jgi:RNA polymerase sigma-70 factor (sigma-E family)
MSEATVPLMREQTPSVNVTVHEPFEVLYQREFRPMVRLATALVDAPDQAEEVVQEAFAALYVRYRVVDNPVAYLRVCVLNGGRKVLRRRRLMRQQPPITTEHGELVFNHVIDAVRRLPTKQRNVVVLRYEMQLSDQEIAETLGVPVGTVKSTLHRALARLRTEVS